MCVCVHSGHLTYISMAALINWPKIRPISSHTETGNANLIVQKINALKNAIKKKNIKPAMENFRTKVKLDERKVNGLEG